MAGTYWPRTAVSSATTMALREPKPSADAPTPRGILKSNSARSKEMQYVCTRY